MHDAKSIFEAVLAPCEYDHFFNAVFGQKPLIQLGDTPQARVLLAGADARQILLDQFGKYAPKLTCHAKATHTPPPKPRAVEDAESFWALIQEYHALGYTVRIPDVVDFSPALTRYTRAIEQLIRNPVGTVVFWSHAGAEAPIHYDEVDVIVIQLTGRKRWFIADDESALPNRWKALGEPQPGAASYKTVDVEPGDFIYLPRGTVHTVQSTTESIHLSIGFTPTTVRDGVNALLDYHSESTRDCRVALGQRADQPFSEESLSTGRQQLKHELEALLARCESDEFVTRALRRRDARMIGELPRLQPLSGQPPLTARSRVKHSPLAMVQMLSTEQIIDFAQPGEHLLVHKGVEASMRFIANTTEFNLADIPGGFGDDIRVALVQRLVQVGFLHLVN